MKMQPQIRARALLLLKSMSSFLSGNRELAFYIGLAFLYLYGASLTYFQATVREQSVDSTFLNTLCSDPSLAELQTSGIDNINYEDICTPPAADKVVDKFIMFATDCWPVDDAKAVFEAYQSNSIVYEFDIPGAKYSHAIYTSILTGQLATNYEGKPIKGDQLIRSMHRSKSYKPRLEYVGPEWCFLAIMGKENYDDYFEDIRYEPEPLDVPYEHAYPWLFSDLGLNDTYLHGLVERGRSLVSHSAVFDHRQHGEHRALGPSGTDFPLTKRLARRIQADFKLLKKWLDSHPEYTLILFSDHGQDEYFFGGYRMHGRTEDGNEPFLMLYNAKFKPSGQRKRLDIVDVCPTLSQFFPGVDIPANSMGVVHTFYGERKSIDDYRAAKRNLLQLRGNARKRGLRFDDEKLSEVLKLQPPELELTDDADDANYTDPNFAELQEFATSVKEQMYGVMDWPYREAFIYSSLALLSTLYIIINFNPRLDDLIAADRFKDFATELGKIFAIYASCYIQMFFCWEGWIVNHRGGLQWRAVSPMLALLFIKHVGRLPSRSSALLLAEKLMYSNELTNLAVLLTTSCFSELVGFLNEDGYAGRQIICAVLAFVMIRSFYAGAHRTEYFVALYVLAMLEVFFTTSEFPWLYSYVVPQFLQGGIWNVFALQVYLIGGLLMPAYLIVKAPERAVVFISLVLFMLQKDSFSNQMFLALFNYQFFARILPMWRVFAEFHRGDYNPSMRLSRSHRSIVSVCLQILGVYALSQTYFAFAVYFGENASFDVHPLSGRIGLDAYDRYPLLSSMFMVMHKYGIFVLMVFYCSELCRPELGSAELLPRHHGDSARRHVVMHTVVEHLFVSVNTLYCAMTGLGLTLMLSLMTRNHAREEALSSTLLSCLCCFCLCAFRVRVLLLSRTAKHANSAVAAKSK